MALSAFGFLALHGRIDGHLSAILLLYAAGGTLAFPFAVLIADAVIDWRGARRPETHFAALFLCLTLATIAATAFLFAMQYRLFFERWHGAPWSYGWTLRFIFTSASAVYQFIAMGVRLYLPLGLPMLIGMSLWLATRPRAPRQGGLAAASD